VVRLPLELEPVPLPQLHVAVLDFAGAVLFFADELCHAAYLCVKLITLRDFSLIWVRKRLDAKRLV
jgi:hypothetical protein